MSRQGLIPRVKQRMADTGATQSSVALACGISQPHLSKVLSNRLKLARKTQQRLELWLTNGWEKPGGEMAILKSISEGVAKLDRKRRMQFMQLLKALEGLLDD